MNARRHAATSALCPQARNQATETEAAKKETKRGARMGIFGTTGPCPFVSGLTRPDRLAIDGKNAPPAITTDGTNVYFTEGRWSTVVQCPVTGCNPPASVGSAVDPLGIAVEGTDVFWTELGISDSSSRVSHGTVGESSASILLANQGGARVIAVRGGILYWANAYGTVRKCTANDCAATVVDLVTEVEGGASGHEILALVVDATAVYWTDRYTGKVLSCAIGGCNGTPTALATAQKMPVGLAVDEHAVYWANYGPNPGDGALMKLAR